MVFCLERCLSQPWAQHGVRLRAQGVSGYQPNDVMIPHSAPVTCTIFSVSFYPSDRLTTFITLYTNRGQVKWNIMLILRDLPTNIDMNKVSSATNFAITFLWLIKKLLIFSWVVNPREIDNNPPNSVPVQCPDGDKISEINYCQQSHDN